MRQGGASEAFKPATVGDALRVGFVRDPGRQLGRDRTASARTYSRDPPATAIRPAAPAPPKSTPPSTRRAIEQSSPAKVRHLTRSYFAFGPILLV